MGWSGSSQEWAESRTLYRYKLGSVSFLRSSQTVAVAGPEALSSPLLRESPPPLPPGSLPWGTPPPSVLGRLPSQPLPC